MELISEKGRLLGNQYYDFSEYDRAIDTYNVVIACSTSEQNRGVTYANRAAVYLATKSYRECLLSIRLAKLCPLPPNTALKVRAREQEALRGLLKYENQKKANVAKLGYPPNERVPSFVRSLKLKDHHDPFGGVVATQDLKKGDIVIIEPPLAAFPAGDLNFALCTHCLQRSGGLHPCKCYQVMFCSPKCKNAAFAAYHNYECPLLGQMQKYTDGEKVAMRVFFNLIQRFADVADLREYLENIKKDPPNPFDDKYSKDSTSFLEQYRLYYASEQPSMPNCKVNRETLLSGDITNKSLQLAVIKAAHLTHLLKTCKQIPKAAKTDDEWLFISELLFHSFFYDFFTRKTLWSNPKPMHRPGIMAVLSSITSINKEAIGSGAFGTASLIRSSTCKANLTMFFEEGAVVVRTLKAVPCGSELLSYAE